MTISESERVGLRREVYDLKEQAVKLLGRVTPVDADAAAALIRARSALFEAWTVLCAPPGDDEDH